MAGTRAFYEAQHQGGAYANGVDPGVLRTVERFVQQYGLRESKILEVGCGRGGMQDLVHDWTGTDVAGSAGTFIRKPFVQAPADALPFPDATFDALWSLRVLEHLPELEGALKEMGRVLKPGGLLLLMPAWFCRPWAAQGYQVRPWSDFGWPGKLVKASIPLRNAVWFRFPGVLWQRLVREWAWVFRPGPTPLHHRRLQANYEVFWQADSDACNSIDPHDLLLWFLSRGWQAPGRANLWRRFGVRGGALVLQKPGKA